MVDGQEQVVSAQDYREQFFGKVAHINFGWVPTTEDPAPVYEPAPATIFDKMSPETPDEDSSQPPIKEV
jgi:hypothetical protein